VVISPSWSPLTPRLSVVALPIQAGVMSQRLCQVRVMPPQGSTRWGYHTLALFGNWPVKTKRMALVISESPPRPFFPCLEEQCTFTAK